MVLNGDSFCRIDLKGMLDFHRQSQGALTLAAAVPAFAQGTATAPAAKAPATALAPAAKSATTAPVAAPAASTVTTKVIKKHRKAKHARHVRHVKHAKKVRHYHAVKTVSAKPMTAPAAAPSRTN